MIHVGDSTWNLRVYITDLQVEKTLRVRGDLHIGGVMLKLVDPENPKDWSDHALWWPTRNMWLTRTKSTLDQVGLHADALLYFTPMHKTLRVQMPDLRYLDCRVDFSIKTFGAVVALCKDLGIRHPEELSLCNPLEPVHLKKNYADLPKKKIPIEQNGNGREFIQPAADTNTFIPASAGYFHGSNGSLDGTTNVGPFSCAPVQHANYNTNKPTLPVTPIGSPTGTLRHNNSNGYTMFNESSSSLGEAIDNLAYSPCVLSPEARSRLVKPKTLVERARMNVGWLDSSLSIMEQGIREFDTLCLRFKYYTFFDLNPKYDQVRINQLYEQAKWQLLNEEIECTEEEMLMFGALQFQVNLQNEVPQPDSGIDTSSLDNGADDDVDAALRELQITLEGPNNSHNAGDITHIPELTDYLRFLKPKKFTLKGYKRYWFTYKDLHLHLYKSRDDVRSNNVPQITINLRGCEVTPEVNLAHSKFNIKLEVPLEQNTNSEMWIRCDSEDQYAKWMAACRLASKGRSLADSSYDSEVSSIKSFLSMQKPAQVAAVTINPNNIDPNEYISPRYSKKLKNKAVTRMLEAHANVKDLSLIDAKLNFIRAWQSLPEFGVTLFVIKFDGHKKEELLGVASNRIMKMDINTGDHLKTWRYNTMKAWNVNWEIKCMMIQLQGESVIFSSLSADCKVIHEFIGGYIFMSMRSKETNQTLNEELFHKLTGGWN
ncbi:unc-112-related protein isoform X2 [Malaya genurostris]|uniref:unc-112-related protein isoform X2 n=2 Tax=Malaya genurostris TaxID=325434 RepID=UPI0026F38E8F|nr:unc-112-related protein isoform X2 [Malaya genurostris]